ncbi:MAG: nucleoside hydrolase [Isosphaeraceae bacterium]
MPPTRARLMMAESVGAPAGAGSGPDHVRDAEVLSMFLTSLLSTLLTLPAAPASPAADPVPLIFDTDICGDCDDVLALGMIHALQTRNACRLIAVTVSVDHPQAGPFVDAVNTFYGRGDVPVGVVGKGGVVEPSGFLALADQRDGDALRFPRDLKSSQDAPGAVAVLRKALASQPDGSVVIAQVGFSTNLARLLDSPADEHSPLKGEDLVKAKVKLLSLMAGAFQSIDGNAHYLEYNVVKDVPSARALAARWPTPMVWSGFEIGIALPYPAVSIERDYGYVAHHPVAEAYIKRNPPPHNRPTWDLTSVLFGVLPDRGYFKLSEPGTVTVESDGFTTFRPDASGRHRYLILDPAQGPRVLEALVQLSSQPPCPARSSNDRAPHDGR